MELVLFDHKCFNLKASSLQIPHPQQEVLLSLLQKVLLVPLKFLHS